jgi:regulator of protease activity HflC (stomatin/prohibitin superfamily)
MPLFTLTVNPGECLLERRPGLPTRALQAGKHRRRHDATYVVVDLRQRLTQLAPQDVPTSDGLTAKVTIAVRWTVLDAVRFTELAADPFALVYLAAQVVLRDALAEVPVESAVAAARRMLADPLREAADRVGRPVGIEVLDVVVKDVMVPADVRAAYGQLVMAKHQAQIKLETARAETAALRSLANAAKLLDDHPALAKLRLVESLPYGSKLELTLGE